MQGKNREVSSEVAEMADLAAQNLDYLSHDDDPMIASYMKLVGSRFVEDREVFQGNFAYGYAILLKEIEANSKNK